MDNFFCASQLDFIALESMISSFETENHLDALDDIQTETTDSDDISSANESVTDTSSDFAFGADLFEESIATESTVVEPAMEGVGAKIWGAIKSIFNAIANFFKNLFKKATETKTKTENVSKTASETLSGAKVEVTKSSSSSTTTATDTSKKSDKRAKAEAKLKAAAAGSSGSGTITPIMNSEKDYNKGYAKDVPNGAGPKLQGAVRMLTRAISEYCSAIGAACNDVSGSKIKLICAKIDMACKRMGGEKAADKFEEKNQYTRQDTKFNTVYNRNSKKSGSDTTLAQDADTLADVVADAERREANLVELRDKIYDQYNKIEEEWRNDGYVITVIKGGDKNRGATLDLSKYAYLDMWQKENFGGKLQSACKSIMDAASNNINFCDKMMKIASANANGSGDDSATSNAVFKLCKSYLAVSKVYGKISGHIDNVASGAILRRKTNAV